MGLDLFIDAGGSDVFDADAVRAMLDDIPGVSDIKGPEHAPFGGVYNWIFHYGDEEVYAKLSDDFHSIITHGLSDGALQLAIEIQKRWPRRLSVFDEGYNFHFEFQDITTVEEFWRRIDEEDPEPD